MAEFIGTEEKFIDIDEPVIFENKTDSDFEISAAIVFRKSGLYDVSIVGRRTIVSKVAERESGAWIEYIPEHGECPFCGNHVDLLNGKANNFCGECGADMRGKQDDS